MPNDKEDKKGERKKQTRPPNRGSLHFTHTSNTSMIVPPPTQPKFARDTSAIQTRQCTVPRRPSISDPSEALEAHRLLLLRSFYSKGREGDNIEAGFSITRDNLEHLLQCNDEEKKGEQSPSPSPSPSPSTKRRRKVQPKQEWSSTVQPSPILMHAWWSTKQNVSPAESLLKTVVLPLADPATNWIFYVMVKGARIGRDDSAAPACTVHISKGESSYSSVPLVSWDPSWNQMFYFMVSDIKTDVVTLILEVKERKGKEITKGICKLDISSFYVPYGYIAPKEEWLVVTDAETNKSTTSFLNVVAQLVPENTECFTDLSNESIRILPNNKQYIEQFGAHLSKNNKPTASQTPS